MLRLTRLLTLVSAFSLSLIPASSRATPVVHVGTSGELSVSATFTIVGNVLTIVLSNDSTSSTASPAELLTSLYFDIQNPVLGRPTLAYVSATGDVYLADATGPEVQAPTTNLVADSPGDGTWQFKSDLALEEGTNLLTFGIGTAGNSSLDPNNFNGNIVGGFDYGIYAGDIGTKNLDGELLVDGTVTFMFSGVGGFTEEDISELVLFGFGTRPELTVSAPEPGTFAMVGLGLFGMHWAGRWRSRAKRI